jgi:hypothetical protein
MSPIGTDRPFSLAQQFRQLPGIHLPRKLDAVTRKVDPNRKKAGIGQSFRSWWQKQSWPPLSRLTTGIERRSKKTRADPSMRWR